MKKFMKTITIVLALASLAAGCSRGDSSSTPPASTLVAGGAAVTITQVQGNVAPAVAATALDINDNNQAVGYVEATAGAPFTAALWTVGGAAVTPKALAPLTGNTFSAAFAIDGTGRAVGQSAKGGQLVAVTWPTGATFPTELPALDAAGNSTAFGISADGTCIVGEAQSAALTTRAVIWVATAAGAFTNPPIALPVNLIGSAFSSANTVVRTGTQILVAGEAEDGEGIPHATLWRSTDGAVFAATDLGTAGETGSSALAVNAAGKVVGESETAPGVFAAALWTPDNAGAYSRTILAANGVATGINNSGKVVGTAAGLATAWDTTALIFGTTTLFPTASQAYGNNNGDASGYLVIGVNDGKGFVKKLN